VATGKTLLLRDVGEDLPPDLAAALRGLFGPERKAARATLSGREVDVAPAFALYLACKAHDAALGEELVARATVVDFGVAAEGFEGRVLGLLLQRERPDAHRSRLALQQDLGGSRGQIAESNQAPRRAPNLHHLYTRFAASIFSTICA
jgi:hypothetical protein